MAVTTLAAPLIDWGSLGKVAGVSFIFGVAVITLFSFGILGLSWSRGHEGGREDADPSASGLAAMDSGRQEVPVEANHTNGVVLATVCFAVCVAAVLYGLYLIIPQFHK